MIRCVLTDIEGTTSSIEFVHKVLFPYARRHMEAFLRSSQDSEVEALIRSLWAEDLGRSHDEEPDLKQVTALLQTWIDQDLKQPKLKALQGKIWKEGYESKAYCGHVYSEVPSVFKTWKDRGLSLAIYSSGSIEAQKLLFAHTDAGNLTSYIDDYFDTGVGQKRDSNSYRAIAGRLALPTDEILFLSDIKEELDAAAEVGMKTIQLLREPLPVLGQHPSAQTFDEVLDRMETM